MNDQEDTRPQYAELCLLRARLKAEGESELLKKISICQTEMTMACTSCAGRTKIKMSCKRKWCPCCARQLAAGRVAELDLIIKSMRHPLFVTLTMKNVSEISSGDVRRLRRCFGKLRHRKIWKTRVTGGAAAIEIVNTGKGWHPHIHAIVECKWLAIKTPEESRYDRPAVKKAKRKAAAQEFERIWSKILGQESSSVKISRVSGASQSPRDNPDSNPDSGPKNIGLEVLKYAITAESLLSCKEPIGDMLRAIDGTRMMTTFGVAHGSKVRDIRLTAKARLKAERQAATTDRAPRCGCGDESFMPLRVMEMPSPEYNDRMYRKYGYGTPSCIGTA